MLRSFKVSGFKSLKEVRLEGLPALTVFFGPNAAGKSNILDAIQALSRIATARTLAEALQEPIRGYPIEAFSFPSGGLPALLGQPSADFTIGAEIGIGKEKYGYKAIVRIEPDSGSLAVSDEYLARLTKSGATAGNPSIEKVGDELRIRRKSKPAHPRHEDVGLNHTLLSDPRLSGNEYKGIEVCRNELSGWRTYFLDARVAMRRATSPADVSDIGTLGENLAPFLYRLKAEREKEYSAVVRSLRAIIPSVSAVAVDLDKRRGTLDIVVTQEGVEYSSRIVSEGTLRVLALCALALNPWGGSLVALEEPENGVHPRRLELIGGLLKNTAERKQVVVTTHSPIFCAAMIRLGRDNDAIGLYRVRTGVDGTEIEKLADHLTLLADAEIRSALTEPDEGRVFEDLLLRGALG